MNSPTDTSATKTAKRVLCIEDEAFISELYSRALMKAGYEVTVASDGQQGLKEALTDGYDIILLDLMMPSLTGMDILDKLRGPGAPRLHAKIIVTTNLEQREESRAAIEKMADAYLIKATITPHELVLFLDQLKI